MTTDPAETVVGPDGEAAEFWESHYQRHRPTERSAVNPLLAEIAESLPPGSALDLGCGNGGDTLWLAEHGWRVASVDISAAESIIPGGRLLVVDHGAIAPGSWNRSPQPTFPPRTKSPLSSSSTPLNWLIKRADTPHRRPVGPGGQTAEVVDHVLMVRRRDD